MSVSGHASGNAVIGATIGGTIIAALSVFTRLFTRMGIVNNAGLDDIFIIFALIFSVGLTATMCQQVKYGMGQHFDTLSEATWSKALVWFWASVWIYYLSLCFTKASILLQYLRIFPQKGLRMACYALMGVVFIYTCWTVFSAIFACIPVASFWDPNIKSTHCMNKLAVWFSNAGINIATDVATVALPLPMLNGLNIPKRQKVMLIGVFAIGGFTCIVSILRLVYLYPISVSKDVTWDNPMAAIWSSVEVNTGILCSCLPTLKGCISRFFPKLFNSYHVNSLSGMRNTPGPSGSRLGMGSKGHIGLSSMDRRPKQSDLITQNSIVHCRGESDSDEIEFGRPEPDAKIHPENDRKIQVVTVVEQDVSRRTREVVRSESESTRYLIPDRYDHV